MNRRRALLAAVIGVVAAAFALRQAGGWLWRKLRELHGGGRRPHS